LIELPGLKVSSYASTVAATTPRVMLLMRTIGVPPTASRIVSQIGFNGASAFNYTGEARGYRDGWG
jgi:3-oxoacyl-[acyl-carrier-protein] synthase III